MAGKVTVTKPSVKYGSPFQAPPEPAAADCTRRREPDGQGQPEGSVACEAGSVMSPRFAVERDAGRRRVCWHRQPAPAPLTRGGRRSGRRDRKSVSPQSAIPLSSVEKSPKAMATAKRWKHYHQDSHRCPRCGVKKSSGDFYRDKSKSNGRRFICKACDLAKSKAYYNASRRVVHERRECVQCGMTFLPPTRRSKRCPTCASDGLSTARALERGAQ